MSSVQRPRPRTGSTAALCLPGQTPRQPASPAQTLLRGARSSTNETARSRQEATKVGPRLSTGAVPSRTRRTSIGIAVPSTSSTHIPSESIRHNATSRTSRVSLSGQAGNDEATKAMQAPSATIALRRRSLMPAMGKSASQRSSLSPSKPESDRQQPGTPLRRAITTRQTRLSESSSVRAPSVEARVTATARATIQGQPSQTTKPPAQLPPAASPFQGSSSRAPELGEDCVLLRQRVEALTQENEALASQLADARVAQSDAEAHVEKSRFEAALSRDEANAALLQVQAQQREIKKLAASPRKSQRVASLKLPARADTDCPLIRVHEDADAEASVSISIDALRRAAEHGQGLTQEAARTLEREFAGQERILKALQRDNETKTKEVGMLKKHKLKLEAFCSRFFGEADWRQAVYGGKNSTQAAETSQVETVQDCDASHCEARASQDCTQVDEIVSPVRSTAERGALRARDINSGASALDHFPSCSSPVKPLRKSRSSAGGLTFVSALNALDASSFATADGNTTFESPQKGQTGVYLERAIIDAVIEAQTSLLQAVHQH